MNDFFFSKEHAVDSVEGWIEISITLQKTTKLTKTHLIANHGAMLDQITIAKILYRGSNGSWG